MSDSEGSALTSAHSVDTPATAIESQASVKTRKRKSGAAQTDNANKRARKTRAIKPVNYEESDEDEVIVNPPAVSPRAKKGTPKKSRTSIVKSVKVEEEAEIGFQDPEAEESDAPQTAKRGKKAAKVKVEVKEPKAAVKKKRKTKEEKEAEMAPLAARTIGSKILIGAHVSSAGGVHNAIVNSVHIGGNALALFLKSQRKWENPALQDDHCTQFLSSCKEHNYHGDVPPVVPHGSYLVNLAHPDADRTKQAYTSFLDDLNRCRRLGIKLYNFHPGNSAASESREAGIAHLAGQLNKAHKDPSSGDVVTLLETMAAGKNVLGSTFEDLANTIELVEDKERVGVCLDTCHVFAAGYDLRTPEAFKDTMDKFDKIIGLKYLRALHVNDSKAPLNSARDLHANIGTGFLGLRAFHNLVNEPRLWGLPMVLETPIDVKDDKTGKEVPDKGIWAREIKLLESLVGMDIGSEEFKKLETELSEKGRSERERIQAQVDKRETKANTPKKKKGGKRKKKDEPSSASESS